MVGIVRMGLIIGIVSGWMPLAWAESRPMKDLPADLVQWSTMWVEVPKQMVEVGKDDWALAALTWGPAKGTAMMLKSGTKKLWDSMKPDQSADADSSSGSESDVMGPVFRYTF